MKFLNHFKKTCIIFVLLISATAYPPTAYPGSDLEISKDFTLFTSEHLGNYLKPLFTTINESFNSHIFTTAQYGEHWSIALDISVNEMIIPSSQQEYDAVLPSAYGDTNIVRNALLKNGTTLYDVAGTYKEPTIYGGGSKAIFSAHRFRNHPDTLYKSVAFADGNNLNYVAGVPAIQLIAGFPTRSQLRLRYWGAPVQGEFTSYFGIMVNQQIDHFFKMFGEDSSLGLALNFAYHNLDRDYGISIHSWSIGTHFSKTWENGFTGYLGLQYEDMSGSFFAVKKDFDTLDRANSPYDEVRNNPSIAFDISTFTNIRFGGGVSYRTGALELHADAAIASQPVLTAGITIWIAEWGQKERDKEKIEKFEEIEKIEEIKKKEKKSETKTK